MSRAWRLLEPLPLLGPALWRAEDDGGREGLAEVLDGAPVPWVDRLRAAAPPGMRLPESATAGGRPILAFGELPSLRMARVHDAHGCRAMAGWLGGLLGAVPPEAMPPKILLLGQEPPGALAVPCARPDRWSAPERPAAPSQAAPYLFAALLHAAVSGKSPQDAPYVFRPLGRFLPDVDARGAELVQACLHPSPEARPGLRTVVEAFAGPAAPPGRPVAGDGGTRLLDAGPATVLLPLSFAEVEWRGVRARHALVPGDNLLGRGVDADVPLPAEDDAASRRHAKLALAGERFVIEDLGSRNGTLVNGRRITAATEVRAGDEVRLGQTIVRIVTGT